MKVLGSVVNFSPKGSIVIRADITPRIGQTVCDKMGAPVGRIVRITGPVDRPYVMVSGAANEETALFRLRGRKVFLDDSPRHTERRERFRKQSTRTDLPGQRRKGPPAGARDRQRGGGRPKGKGGYGRGGQSSGNQRSGSRKKARR
ncbi:MAG: H/ACA ribonucleoprotein complex subunit GAR1 [Thermoplasmatota archaeon]